MGLRLPALIILACASQARAAPIVFDPSSFPDPSQLISEDLANSAARAMGLVADHRPYEPATTLQPPIGLDLSVELTLIKVPEDFLQELEELGMASAELTSAIPVPRLNVHKGLGTRAEVGFSYISYRGYRIAGGDFKVNVSRPDEGPAWALRFIYNTASMGFLSTKSYTPQLLISRPLDFAEPYLGIGYQYATAEIAVELDPLLPVATAQGRGGGFMSFLGVGLRIPMLGVKITLEGAYSQPGAHSLGLKSGLCF
jgi:hypothetical protein